MVQQLKNQTDSWQKYNVSVGLDIGHIQYIRKEWVKDLI